MTKDLHIKLILEECKRQGIVAPNQLAYIMATVQHETAGTFTPLDEYGGRKARYAPYWGRGYVQLTWKANYQKYAKLTGLDLVNFPDKAKDHKTAAFILVHGFKHGTFTGKKISDYISDRGCDFNGARRCINGTDKAALIAGYARAWVEKIARYTA